jgi:hypothetical protein
MVKSKRMRWAGHVVCMVKRKSTYRFLVGKPKRKRPIGRHKFRLENNIKMDLQEVEWGHGLD